MNRDEEHAMAWRFRMERHNSWCAIWLNGLLAFVAFTMAFMMIIAITAGAASGDSQTQININSTVTNTLEPTHAD